MVRAFSHNDTRHIDQIKRQIDKFNVGGICFFQGDPGRQITLVNEYQALSDIPLTIAIDGEWGLGMRFPDKATSFPRQMTLGAIRDDEVIFRMGKEIGRQMSLLGIDVNFAPSVDINNNRENPVINFRSFGEDPYNVMRKAMLYADGMKHAGVSACLKHFPGHGDTDVDSHYDLPIISHGKGRLDSIELYPFRHLVNFGIPAVMVAHLQVPALDDRTNRPASVSDRVITGLLRDELKFDGLVYTDAMEMKGVTKHFGPGEADVQAFIAGNDVILLPENLERSFDALKKAVDSGIISEERIDKSVRRILESKQRFNQKSFPIKSSSNLAEELNSIHAKNLSSEIYEKSLTLVSNAQNALPLIHIQNLEFGSVALGSDQSNTFQERLASYIPLESSQIAKTAPSETYLSMVRRMQDKDVVFVSIHDMSWYASRNFGLNLNQIEFVKRLAKRTKVILTIFGSPYSLKYFEDVPTTLIAYEDNALSQEAAAQALFGVTSINGRLPVTGSDKYEAGHGITIDAIQRIGFSNPERVGLSMDSLRKIEGLLDEMIAEKASPGCQVLVAKDNRIVYWKSFGHHTYDRKIKSDVDDVYDVASITKIMATTISAMKLQDEGSFDVRHQVRQYIPEEDTTNKAGLVYEDLLAHVSGLAAWIPFYTKTMTDDRKPKHNTKYYRTELSDSFDIEVIPKLYLRSDYQDTIWRKIFSSKLNETTNYRYSDLAFYIMNRTIKNITGVEVDEFAKQTFYGPLGLRKTLFNPLKSIDPKRIPPTEKDNYFRLSTVHGRVHDMGAAMLNGVSGHAGLFSNGYDLAVLMQMLLNEGYYGGIRYLSPETVDQFTQRHWRSSRRGLGFDMKELNPRRSLNMSELASRHTFGHLGFTGTAVFADPEEHLIFVFLSNRTYPTMGNNRLGRKNYRPKVQSLVYDAFLD